MKTTDTITLKVLQVTADMLGVNQNLLTYNTSFADDLGADSLDVYELIMSIEKEFKLNISEDDVEKLTTVGSLIKYVSEKVSPQKQPPSSEITVSKELQEGVMANSLLQLSHN